MGSPRSAQRRMDSRIACCSGSEERPAGPPWPGEETGSCLSSIPGTPLKAVIHSCTFKDMKKIRARPFRGKRWKNASRGEISFPLSEIPGGSFHELRRKKVLDGGETKFEGSEFHVPGLWAVAS